MNIPFYKNQVVLNVLTNSVENSKKIFEAAEGHVLVGILSANYSKTDDAVEDIKKHQAVCDGNVSLGLGQGNPEYCYKVAEIASAVKVPHINQVFPIVGFTRGKSANENAFINSLVSPSGKVGYVLITTGPESSRLEPVIVPIDMAITLIKEMGGSSVKYFPMNGLKYREEYIAVTKACAKANFALEPTGGITLDNFEEILQIAVDNNVPKIIPHVYSSIIDKDSKDTNVEDIKTLMSIIKRVVV